MLNFDCCLLNASRNAYQRVQGSSLLPAPPQLRFFARFFSHMYTDLVDYDIRKLGKYMWLLPFTSALTSADGARWRNTRPATTWGRHQLDTRGWSS
jgi:hypothetical protein